MELLIEGREMPLVVQQQEVDSMDLMNELVASSNEDEIDVV